MLGGTPDGPIRYYYRDKLTAEIQYRDNAPSGRFVIFDRDGKRVFAGDCKNGTLIPPPNNGQRLDIANAPPLGALCTRVGLNRLLSGEGESP